MVTIDKKKPEHHNQPKIPWPVVGIAGLCGFFFLLGNQLCENSTLFYSDGGQYTVLVGPGTQDTKYEPCDPKYQDVTPCMDPERWSKYDKTRMAFRERHCPSPSEKLRCLVPPPPGYLRPIPWPQSRDECWYKNIPSDWIANQKANQKWVQREGDKFVFPGGGTMFPRGVSEYLDKMQELVPGMANGSVRTAIDTGCGVASFGGYLLDRGIITMSIAPRDNHEAQVQFALERGFPAMLGILSTRRLPYPARSFDLAHCSRCLIPWTAYGGQFLVEINRILRPGGFWVLSGPPVNYEEHWKGWNTTIAKQEADMAAIEELLGRMCFQRVALSGDLAVWQKPTSNDCYLQRRDGALPPICDDSVDPDSAWYVPMRLCIDLLPDDRPLAPWPKRLVSVPDRVKRLGGGASVARAEMRTDSRAWVERARQYKALLPEVWRGGGHVRNVLDMNAEYGGFAAALKKAPVWVMNVVPAASPRKTLGVVFERGLIGAYHDWCEAFDTYPRTYDLVHAYRLLSAHTFACELGDILLEMDRILRPRGVVLLRDTPALVELVATIAPSLHWQCHHVEGSANALASAVGAGAGDGGVDGGDNAESVLVCRKQFWRLMKKGSKDGQ